MKEIFESVELEIIVLDDVITDLDLFQASGGDKDFSYEV